MRVNQKGEEIVWTRLFSVLEEPVSDQERDKVIELLLERLDLEVWRTNATKSGDVEIRLRGRV